MAGRVEFNKKKLINGDFASGQPLRNEGMKLQDAAAAAATAFTVASALSAASSGAASAASGALTDAVSDVADAIGDAFTAAATALATPSALSGAVADLVSDAEASVDALAATLGTATSTGAAADIKAGIDKLLADLKTNAKGLATAAGATSAEMTTLDSVLANIADGITIEWDKAATVYGVKLAADAKADAASGAAVTASDAAIFASDAFVAFSGLHSDWATAKTGDAGSIYFQVGPNANQGWTLNIGKITCQGIGLATGAITEDGIAVDAATQGNIDPNSKINVLKMTGEDDLTGLLDTIDAGLTVVTTERSKLGAAQNRLEYTIKSLDITSENLSSAESRIRDTDMAKEMMKLTKANILQQAGISMLAQANQSPQSVLQLLQ
jgi:flagellin